MATSSSSLEQKRNYDVFLSFRGIDVRNNFLGHLYMALYRNGIFTYLDNEKLKKGEQISSALMNAIEESRVAIIVFSEDYASSLWCLEEMVKIMECKDERDLTVFPVFYKVKPCEVRTPRESYKKAMDKHEDKFKEDPEKVQRWKKALFDAGNLSGWHFTDGDESKFIESIVKEVSAAIVGRVPLSVAKYPVGVGCQAEKKTLLSEILRIENLEVFSVDGGVNLIRDRLHSKKILLVLDDVDHQDQLNALARDCECFGKGSKIIVTTRDTHPLTSHGIDVVYEVKALGQVEAFKLLNSYAFPRNQTKDISRDLIDNILDYADGLPLAIVVLGSLLCGRSRGEWENILCKLAECPNKDINRVLKISFDSLEDNEKDIFLDIACFFKGRDSDYITRVLQICGLKTIIGIQTLKERALITIESQRIVQMHDLIQQMGQDIVIQECPDDPGKRSRLWRYNDVFEVLSQDTGTVAIKGIVLDLPTQEELDISPNAFTLMRRLRLLIVLNARISGDPICLPNDLRFFEWPEYPFSTLKFSAGPKKLVWLDVNNSRIKELGGNLKHFKDLKFLNFSRCELLITVPDISETPNLETLNLNRCSNLKELPRKLKLKRLQTLDATGCSKLDKFPEIEEMESLTNLYLSETSLKELPSSIEKLISVKVLILNSCKSLISLPSSIYKMQSLEHLSLENCSRFALFPKNGESSNLPNGRRGCPNLVSLKLSGCNLSEAEFLQSLSCFSSLNILHLSGNNFATLPTCISKFEELMVLKLDGCKQLQEILELPPNICTLEANGCNALSRFPKLPIQCIQSSMSMYIRLDSCHRLVREGVNLANIISLEDVHEMGDYMDTTLPGREIPCWFIQSLEHSVSFWVPRHLHADILGLALCVAFELEEGIEASVSCEVQVLVNYIQRNYDKRTFSSIQSDHLWFHYFPRHSFDELDEMLETEWSLFQVSFEVSEATLRRCGFRLVCKQAEDDLRVLCQNEFP